MGAAKQVIDTSHLSQLTPLNKLNATLLEEALANSSFERFPPGRRLFSQHEVDERMVFLLSGQLALCADGQATITLKADTWEATQPIDNQSPRQYTALASTSITLLSINSDTLNELLKRNAGTNGTNQEATPQPYNDAGLTAALTSPLFSRLPKPHLQVLKKRMTKITAHAGESIIHEGQPGEYYYLITAGRCRATRKAGKNGASITQCELSAGEGFGEGSLIVNKNYDVTVTMLEDSTLLRLSKGEFLTLLVRPFIKWIPYQKAIEQGAAGAILLDTRSTGAYQKKHLADSINIPLNTLHHCAFLMNKARTYIICGDASRRAASAAFLLARQGMDVYILDENVHAALAS